MSNSSSPTNVIECPSKALRHLFTKIRDKNTSPKYFAQYAKRIMTILAEEAIAELPSNDIIVDTPTGVPFSGCEVVSNDKICAVSIIRAGDALLEQVLQLLPGIMVGKILIQRDEESSLKLPKLFYSKFPPQLNSPDSVILLCDPMLATGGSAMKAIEVLLEKNPLVLPKNIVFVNVISCPEGIQALNEKYPDVKIVTACIDEGLNEMKYIVPGLGDYGDRFFNT